MLVLLFLPTQQYQTKTKTEFMVQQQLGESMVHPILSTPDMTHTLILPITFNQTIVPYNSTKQ
jgi:hypothetical protein